jgi:hypothetical protein
MKDVLAHKMTMLLSRRSVLEKLFKASEDAGGYEV